MLGTGSRSPFALTRADRERLAARLADAVRRARRSGTATLATFSVGLADDVDPSAVVCASRRPGERWFAFEQPARGRFALAGLGEAVSLRAEGTERFASVASGWRALAGAAVGDAPEDAGGGGPVAVGGFAFAPEGGRAPHWAGFEPASLSVPEVALSRTERDGRPSVRLTLATLASPDDLAEDLFQRLVKRLEELRAGRLALIDPAPAGRSVLAGAMPPEHYEAAVARAVELIAAGEIEKIVLAREVQVHAAARVRPGRAVRRAARGVSRLLRVLRRARRRGVHRRQPRAAACGARGSA